MRFVIMADGKGMRWNNYLDIPKHLAKVDGEKIISRTVRLLRKMIGECDEIIITSHDPRYEFLGSKRHEPLNNHYEIDRFTEELIVDDMVFLYGDTYYTKDALKKIVRAEPEGLLFFGDVKSIIAIKVRDSKLFSAHKNNVKDSYLAGKIRKCKGWQVYQSFQGQDMNEMPVIQNDFVLIEDETKNINTPDDYEEI